MDFNEYQREARRTTNHNLTERQLIMQAALGMTSEAGEIAGLIEKWQHQGHELYPFEIVRECGDLLWYMSSMLSNLGFGIESAAIHNINKLRRRYPEKFTSSQSVARIDAKE